MPYTAGRPHGRSYPTQQSGLRMALRKRKGMWIKNTHPSPVVIEMKTRTLQLGTGEELLVTAEEVLDSTLRAHLQIRAVSIVRPSTDEEEEDLLRELTGSSGTAE